MEPDDKCLLHSTDNTALSLEPKIVVKVAIHPQKHLNHTTSTFPKFMGSHCIHSKHILHLYATVAVVKCEVHARYVSKTN